MKTCTQCNIEKPLLDFTKRKNRKDGHCSWCKSCYAAKADQRIEKDPENYKLKRKKYDEKNKDL